MFVSSWPNCNECHDSTGGVAPNKLWQAGTGRGFYKKLLDRLSSEPGMQSVAAAWYIPLSGSEIGFTFNFDAHPVPQSQQPAAQFNAVTADYFKTMRVPLRKGRWFAERDDKNAPPVAIVTEAFAKQFFPGEDPIGKRIIVDGSVEPGKPPVGKLSVWSATCT